MRLELSNYMHVFVFVCVCVCDQPWLKNIVSLLLLLLLLLYSSTFASTLTRLFSYKKNKLIFALLQNHVQPSSC